MRKHRLSFNANPIKATLGFALLALLSLLSSCRALRTTARGGTPSASIPSNVVTALPGVRPEPAHPALSNPLVTYESQPLSTEMQTVIHDQLSPDRELIADQSFRVDPPSVGAGILVASKTSLQGVARLNLDWHPLESGVGGGSYPLPVEAAIPQGSFQDVQAIAVGDYNGDGLGPDVIAIADFITGVDPTSSEPVAVTTVYFYQGNNSFTTDITLNHILNHLFKEHGPATIDQAIALVNLHFSYLNSGLEE